MIRYYRTCWSQTVHADIDWILYIYIYIFILVLKAYIFFTYIVTERLFICLAGSCRNKILTPPHSPWHFLSCRHAVSSVDFDMIANCKYKTEIFKVFNHSPTLIIHCQLSMAHFVYFAENVLYCLVPFWWPFILVNLGWTVFHALHDASLGDITG